MTSFWQFQTRLALHKSGRIKGPKSDSNCSESPNELLGFNSVLVGTESIEINWLLAICQFFMLVDLLKKAVSLEIGTDGHRERCRSPVVGLPRHACMRCADSAVGSPGFLQHVGKMLDTLGT